jgi:hypothetical protein
MAKYKQTVIPETSTKDWITLTKNEVRERLYNEYRERYYGKKIINQSLGITVEFEYAGARKTSHGSAVYSKKACLITVLDKLIRYAEYSNWGDRKNTDDPHVIGYLNFKVKVKIDEKVEHVHLVIRVRNTGRFHYAMEVNKIKNR